MDGGREKSIAWEMECKCETTSRGEETSKEGGKAASESHSTTGPLPHLHNMYSQKQKCATVHRGWDACHSKHASVSANMQRVVMRMCDNM